MSQNVAVQVPLQAGESGVQNQNTGFPEPLSMDRNTTLRHPEADTSIHATLECKEVPVSRTGGTHRLPSFRHGHKTSSGKIADADKILQGMHKDIEHVDGRKEVIHAKGMEEAGAIPKGRDSGVEGLGLDGDESNDDGYSSGEKRRRRKGLLNKFGIH